VSIRIARHRAGDVRVARRMPLATEAGPEEFVAHVPYDADYWFPRGTCALGPCRIRITVSPPRVTVLHAPNTITRPKGDLKDALVCAARLTPHREARAAVSQLLESLVIDDA